MRVPNHRPARRPNSPRTTRLTPSVPAPPPPIDRAATVHFAELRKTFERLKKELEEGGRKYRENLAAVRQTCTQSLASSPIPGVSEALRDARAQLEAAGMHEAAAVTHAEHEERARIAHVLHDSLLQILVAATYRLDLLERNADPAVQTGCREVKQLLDDAFYCSRNLVTGLTASTQPSADLQTALEGLAEGIAAQHNVTVRLHLSGPRVPVPEKVWLPVQETVRELLFNVVKHAKASTADLSLARVSDRLEIVVADQGVGFDPRQLTTNVAGVGLRGMRERLEHLGGKVDIESGPGRGSRITLTVPLPAP